MLEVDSAFGGGHLTLTTAFVKGILSMSPGVRSSSPRALAVPYTSVTSLRSLCWTSGRLASSHNVNVSYIPRVGLIGLRGGNEYFINSRSLIPFRVRRASKSELEQ